MSDIRNWLVEDTDPRFEDGEFRVSHGTIMLYSKVDDEFKPVSVQYDAPMDEWGRYESYEVDQPSGHDWVERNEMYDSAWNIGDGWSEADAMGLPGLYTVQHDQMLKRYNVTCNSCFILTPKHEDECQNCGSKLVVVA